MNNIPPDQSVYWHYNATFDALDTIARHAAHPAPLPGYVTNYLGVSVDPMVLPHFLPPAAGTVEPPPIPANWHADIAEWATALRAVELAGDSFTMIELGCGWGCWMNCTGAAARAMGKTPHVIGIEGDPLFFRFAEEALARNGLGGAHTLHRGIAAAGEGTALFPRQDGGSWGLAPVFGASAEAMRAAEAAGSHDALPMVSLARAVAGHDRIDLLHVDIQGGEADLIAATLDLLAEKVAYLLVGTHGREIEGRLWELLLANGWKLEVDRPCYFHMTGDRPLIANDGVQGWRNLRLLPL